MTSGRYVSKHPRSEYVVIFQNFIMSRHNSKTREDINKAAKATIIE